MNNKHYKTDKRILDPCCGGRMFYFDKENEDVLFCDIRAEELVNARVVRIIE